MSKVAGSVSIGEDDDSAMLSGRAEIGVELCTARGDDDVTLGARTTVGGNVNLGQGDDSIALASWCKHQSNP